MSDEEKIRKVKEAVEEAIRLIKSKHAGANLDEARKYLSEAGEVRLWDNIPLNPIPWPMRFYSI